MSHVGLILPVLGLFLFFFLPLPIAGPLYFLLLAYSTWRYRSLIKSKRRPVTAGVQTLIGRTAEVIDVSGSGAQVLVNGEIWKAKATTPLTKGGKVKIVGIEGLTLIVKADDAGN